MSIDQLKNQVKRISAFPNPRPDDLDNLKAAIRAIEIIEKGVKNVK